MEERPLATIWEPTNNVEKERETLFWVDLSQTAAGYPLGKRQSKQDSSQNHHNMARFYFKTVLLSMFRSQIRVFLEAMNKY